MPSAEQVRKQVDASLAFAACARKSGVTDFPDPNADGVLGFPAGTTATTFRTVLDACYPTLTAAGAQLAIDSTNLDFDWQPIVQEAMGGAPGAGSPGSR